MLDTERRLVRGWGINDLGYKVAGLVGDKWRVICPYYEVWSGILARTCVDVSKRSPAYKDATVSEEWRYASAFKKWMVEQPWKGNHCDKDILVPGNKEYGPDKCRFVPIYINNHFLGGGKRPYESQHLPRGVSFRPDLKRRPYIASIKGLDGRSILIGRYNDPGTAHRDWQFVRARKIEQVVAKYSQEDCFDTEIADSLIWRAWKLRNDASAGIITTTL